MNNDEAEDDIDAILATIDAQVPPKTPEKAMSQIASSVLITELCVFVPPVRMMLLFASGIEGQSYSVSVRRVLGIRTANHHVYYKECTDPDTYNSAVDCPGCRTHEEFLADGWEISTTYLKDEILVFDSKRGVRTAWSLWSRDTITSYREHQEFIECPWPESEDKSRLPGLTAAYAESLVAADQLAAVERANRARPKRSLRQKPEPTESKK